MLKMYVISQKNILSWITAKIWIYHKDLALEIIV